MANSSPETCQALLPRFFLEAVDHVVKASVGTVGPSPFLGQGLHRLKAAAPHRFSDARTGSDPWRFTWASLQNS